MYVRAQVVPGVAAVLNSDQEAALFSDALYASGPCSTGVTAAGFATALLDAGLVGCAAHIQPIPAIAHRPPFNECR